MSRVHQHEVQTRGTCKSNDDDKKWNSIYNVLGNENKI